MMVTRVFAVTYQQLSFSGVVGGGSAVRTVATISSAK